MWFEFSVGYTSALRLTGMYTPVVADVREDMQLECGFDMGNEDLYSVKWYKDDHEFFRWAIYYFISEIYLLKVLKISCILVWKKMTL